MTTQSNQENDDTTSLNYRRIRNELEEKRSQSVVNINVGGKVFNIKNQDRLDADIRECDSNSHKIAENLNDKAENVPKIKEHVFINSHILDRYKDLGVEPEVKQFDPSLNQALAWKRLEAGVHTPDDVTWLKHEMAESHYEKKFDSGYCESLVVLYLL